MDNITRTVSMPADHWHVIEVKAQRMGLSVDAAIKQAVRLYQAANNQLPDGYGQMRIALSNEELAKAMREVTAAELSEFSRVIPRPIDPGYWQRENARQVIGPCISPHAVFKQQTEEPGEQPGQERVSFADLRLPLKVKAP